MNKLNSEQIMYIKLQKTFLQNIPDSDVESNFFKSLKTDYEIIKPFLPKKVDNILDIGCGIGGINYHLSKHYKHKTNIHLLDKSGISENIGYGYHKEASFYSSLPMARNFLVDMNVPNDNIFTHDMLNQKFPEQKFDLVISFISWGFHYPIFEYFERVKKNLNSNGLILTDLRKGVDEYNPYDGIHLLKTIGNIKLIYETERYNKIVVEKR